MSGNKDTTQKSYSPNLCAFSKSPEIAGYIRKYNETQSDQIECPAGTQQSSWREDTNYLSSTPSHNLPIGDDEDIFHIEL